MISELRGASLSRYQDAWSQLQSYRQRGYVYGDGEDVDMIPMDNADWERLWKVAGATDQEISAMHESMARGLCRAVEGSMFDPGMKSVNKPTVFYSIHLVGKTSHVRFSGPSIGRATNLLAEHGYGEGPRGDRPDMQVQGGYTELEHMIPKLRKAGFRVVRNPAKSVPENVAETRKLNCETDD